MAFDKRKALQNALAFTQQAKWDRAIAEYQAILKADPRDLTVCNNLGDLYARTGKPAEAIEQYLKLGELYRSDGLSVKAIAVYKKIAKLNPHRTEAYLACADLYQEQGLMGEAKVQLATVVEHFSRAGDTTRVIEIYQRLAQLDPANHALLARLADLLAKQGMREAAAAEYGRAAQAAQAVGQTAESKRLFQKARDMQPDSPEPNLGLAEFQLREGLYAEAVSVLGKVTAADAGNLRAWRLLGEAYGRLGQGAEAIESLQQAIALGLPEAEVSRPLALALIQAGRTDEAVAVCQRFTEAAVGRGEPEAAVSLGQAMVAAAPHLTALRAQLATLLQRLGPSGEARAATWELAAAYEASGESEAAIQVYHKLLEGDPSDTEAQARLEVLEAAPPPAMPQEPEAVPLPAAEGEAAPLFEPPAEAEGAGPGAPEFVLPALEGEPPPILEAPAEDSPAPAESVETFSSVEAGSALTAAEAVSMGAPAEQLQETGEAADVEAVNIPAMRGPEAEAGAGPPAGKPLAMEAAGGFGEIELPSVELPEAEVAAGGLEAAAAEDGFPVDFLGDGMAGLGALEVEAGPSSAVAEHLAEAEVYLKYGLADKARERLKEVVRLAPGHMVARRKLKAIYLERNQIPEACQEILAIAKHLEASLQQEAALREIQEGLELAPADPDLRAHLTGMRGGVAPAPPEASRAPVPTEEPPIEQLPFDLPEALGAVAEPSAQGMPSPQEGIHGASGEKGPRLEEVPALDVPLDAGAEAELASEPSLDAEAGAGPFSLGDEELPAELRALLEDAGDAAARGVEKVDEDREQVMADDLAEAMFYLDQGMLDEARSVHQRMLGREPEHPAVITLGSRLAIGASQGVPEILETATTPVAEEASPPSEESEEMAPPLDLPDLLPPEQPSVVLDAETAGSPFGRLEEAPAPQPYELPIELGEVEAATGVADVSDLAGPETSHPGFEPTFTPPDAGSPLPAEGFEHLGAEPDEGLATDAQAASPTTGGPLMDGLLKEFQRGVSEHLGEKDYETHYNLGIAYREMELYEEAVQEFRLAGREPGRALACADLLGVCFLAMGQMEQALVEFRAGLEIPGHPRESYHTLRYDLGVAYETQGDLARAVEQFERVNAEDPRFRDVRAKVHSLRERMPRGPAEEVAGGPPPTEATPRRSSKKKISFI